MSKSRFAGVFFCLLFTVNRSPVAAIGRIPLTAINRTPVTPKPVCSSGESKLATLLKQAPKIPPQALQMALTALDRLRAHGTAVRSDRLMVIDYNKPSSQPRLWVFDLNLNRLLFEEPVAHGRNSGDDRSTQFSNEPGSLMSSLGVFLTADTYTGKHGLSLRLQGIEKGVNDNSMERAIVIHAANYVRLNSRIGRSWGCPAVRPEISQALIQAVRGGTLMLSYYPRNSLLLTSKLTAPLLRDTRSLPLSVSLPRLTAAR